MKDYIESLRALLPIASPTARAAAMSAAMGETVVLVCANTPMIRQRIKGITEMRNPASDVTLIRLAYGRERIEYRSGGRIFFTAERTFPDHGRGLNFTMLLEDDNL